MRADRSNAETTKAAPGLDRALVTRLLPFMQPYRGLLLLAVLLVILITLLDLALPYLTKTAIDRHIVPVGAPADSSRRYLAVDGTGPAAADLVQTYPHLFRREGDAIWIAYDDLAHLTPTQRRQLREAHLVGLTHLAGLFLLLMVLSFGANLIQQRLMEAAGQKGMHLLRQQLFAHLLLLPVAYFNHNPVGRLVTRVTNDVQNLHELFTSILVFIFKDVLMLLGIGVVLFSMNARLALLTFTVTPAVAAISVYFARQARHVFRTLRTKISEINTRFAETVAGMRVIQLFGQEHNNYQRFKALNHEHYLGGMRQVHIFALFMPMIEVLGSMTVAIIIWQGGAGVLEGRITLGEMVVFLAYMKMFFRPVRDITEKHNILQNALASAERIFQLLDTAPPPEPVTASGRIGKVRRIEVVQLGFAYDPQTPVLQDISFSLPAGQTLALVGATGSGKTSLVQLLLRFYTPSQGRILINDTDIKDISRSQLHRTVALVAQEPMLFSESIAANICGGNPALTESRLQEILELSHCRHLLTRLPQGLNTVLGEGGTLISSGERQLIAIARAFARDPQVIIFDEATSYIDSHSEQQIGQALANLMQGRTTIIVAHRLATIRQADQILVLKQGRIIETGNHDTLMRRKGYYFHLHQLDG